MCRRDLVAAANWSLKARSNAKRAATWLPFFNTGAGEESRTLDLNLGKVALYQLSYSRLEFKLSGGEDGSRTRLHGFAGRCITALLPRQRKLLPEMTAGYALRSEILEREKSLELSTSTLARLRSTN